MNYKISNKFKKKKLQNMEYSIQNEIYAIIDCDVQYSTMQYSVIKCSAMQRDAVHNSIALYCTSQHSTVKDLSLSHFI